ncbi:MAG: efflux RND transporter periplasmic adaptor subunit [Caldilineaceae bacterium]|nr:efflux RND transporter periplasmic adaptor subunit [Caldilineaceae bacterium]
MHPNPKRIIPALLIAAGLIVGVYFYLRVSANAGEVTYSGTIEATEVRVAAMQGGRVVKVHAREGERVLARDLLVEIQPGASGPAAYGKEMLHAPIEGVVLYRSIEPGEIAAPGAPLLTIGDTEALRLTVYVPEDRYGQIFLGETYPVTVDSFPGEVFQGTVSRIAGEAEFTPRNVQTADSRKTTVFAIRLDLAPSGGKLKPGMPADVHFAALR